MSKTIEHDSNSDASAHAHDGSATTAGSRQICRYDELGRLVWQRDPASGSETFLSYYEPTGAEQPAKKSPK